MSLPDAAVEPAAAPWPEDLVPVGAYPTAAEGADHGLVVLAMGLPYWLVPDEGRYALLIEQGGEAAVADQLARYDRESVGWPPPPYVPAPAPYHPSLFTPLLWAMAIMMVFWAQHRSPPLTAAGDLDAVALFQHGEWWRPATALFLHADVGHLVSNLIAGIFVISAVLGAFGLRRGWLRLALAALGGNLLSAAMHFPDPYHSVGASTALFAGLGLLTGQALPRGRTSSRLRPWRSPLAPLGAGLTLLALYGAGADRVDLGAHLAGFVCGLLGGMIRPGRGGDPATS